MAKLQKPVLIDVHPYSASPIDLSNSARPVALPIDLSKTNSTGTTPMPVSPPSATRAISLPRSDTQILASLSPSQRLLFLARKRPAQFLIGLVGAIGSTYIIVRSLLALGPAIAFFVSWQAMAQSPQPAETTTPFINGSVRDAMDWYVALLMGVALLGSMLMVACAKSDTKVSFGMDAGKMIIGFLVGFLSGGKSA